MKFNYRQKKEILIFLLVAALLLGLFHYARSANTDALPFYEQYEHVSNIASGQPGEENPFLPDMILSYTGNYVFFMRFLPYISGLINVFLIFLISKKLMRKFWQRTYTLAVATASPVFLYLYGTYNPVFLPMTFILLGVLGILEEKYLPALLGLITAFVLNPNMFFAIAVILILIFEKTKSKNTIYPFLGIAAIVLFFISTNNLSYDLSVYGLVTRYLSDLGAVIGFGLFILVLGIIGMIISWKNKEKNALIYVAAVTFLIFSVYDPHYIVFLDLIMYYYTGLALYTMMNRKWSTKVLEKYVLLLIFCGLIFSSISYVNRASLAGPRDAEIKSLEWLQNNNDGGRVLSYYEYGGMIEAIGKLEPYVDKPYFLYSKDKTKIKKAEETFQSRDSQEIVDFLDRNNVGYIWINEAMKEGLVWEEDDQGMLLVLEAESKYRKIYDFRGVVIWRYPDG